MVIETLSQSAVKLSWKEKIIKRKVHKNYDNDSFERIGKKYPFKSLGETHKARAEAELRSRGGATWS